MNQIKSIFKNTGWLSVSQVITSICAFLWTIIIARYLGVSDYGIVSFAVSFTGLMGIVMDLGISTYITREIAKHKDLVRKYFNNIFLFKLILAIILFILSGLILYVMGYSHLTIIVTLVFTIELIFMSMTTFLNGVFQAFEKVKYQAIGAILNSSFLLIGILITLGFDLGVISIAFAYTVAYSIYFSYMFLSYVKTFSRPHLELDTNFIREVIIKSIPFGLTNFFYSIYFSIDIVMLSYLAGDYATGLYKSAYNIINVFTTFFVVYQSVIFPVMSKFFKESQNLIKVSYELSVKYLLLIIIPISIGIFFYARPVVDLIYSNQYSLASTPVQILIWTVSFLFVNGAAAVLLNAIDKEKTVTKIYIIAAIFNVCLNLILIPRFSYDGAAIATVLSEILITIITLYHIFKTDYKPDLGLLKNVIKLIVCGIILFVALYYLNLSLWFAIPVGFIVYLISLFITKSIDDNDRYVIRELINR
ncbi:polysaccharide biosynthesis protein [Methanobrevibacter ruminantium M1]|uniref:Polysaccharide biosynthesis protein n=1 Tax=Methanobrevibacter ruminantium (strain ATCC 35063 / DSM 1093 / JCM 13430 / OCM 146 / M1) TaxID=634498 RepID=D3E4B3_METRM|nr:flippase [Methanobrevibacter ruminantium]ADC47374.1 polysaccharide biosynthesis protein [Methanobrevibacter ruminantium M1]